MAPESLLAAVDLGSNSFRLEIGRVGSHQRIERVEYLKEAIRQGNGLNAQHELTLEAMNRGWECLARFGERLAGFSPDRVRAVATQTLREARNRDIFVQRGSELLGFPIEVITGEEEARLIYRGVSSLLPPSQQRRLVIDIGGRSTEVIIGQYSQAQEVASYAIGSVAWSTRFFGDGVLSHNNFHAASKAARTVLQDTARAFPASAWDCAYASSGTANAVADMLAGSGYSGRILTPDGLQWLQEQMQEAGHIDHLRISGLKEDRRAVIAGGLSILRAALEVIGVNELEVAQGALRQGALHELLEHEPPADREKAEISALQHDFGIDTLQAMRVASVAGQLWRGLAGNKATKLATQALNIAAQLHEIGMRIALNDYHRHGGYITSHCSAATWSPELRLLVSQLVLGHQGKLRKLEAVIEDPDVALPLLVLRLAVQLCHARRDPQLDNVTLTRSGNNCVLETPHNWAKSYPQSAQLLQYEAVAWQKSPWILQLELG